jgi:hypothetical protein
MTFSRLKNMTTKGALTTCDQKGRDVSCMDNRHPGGGHKSQEAAWARRKDGRTSAISDIQSNLISAILEDNVFSRNEKMSDATAEREERGMHASQLYSLDD